MNDNGISTNNILNDLSIQQRQQAEQQATGGDTLDRDVFLRLLVTQLENQNPLEPQDNGEFVAQLAQFSSVEGLDNLNDSFSSLASSFEAGQQSSQVLQASALVGRSVVVDSNRGVLAADGEISGKFSLDTDASIITLNVFDSSGALVSTQQSSVDENGNPYRQGEHDFSWDGTNDNGDALESGTYSVEILAGFQGQTTSQPVRMSANVDSVTVNGNGGITLNLAGIGPLSIANVNEIL